MNVFWKFTRASLGKNRSRTLVTIIGIVLSMALFTAVIEGAYSGLEFLRRCEIEETGAYHAYYFGLSADEAERARTAEEVKTASVWQEVGWAEIGSENEFKPYLYVQAVDESAGDLLSLHLLSGRMPENARELLLPAHLASNGNVHYQVGDPLTLELGWLRDGNGIPLTPRSGLTAWEEAWVRGAELTDTETVSYTVVGTYERLSYEIEDYGCPGYYALTAGGGRGDRSVFFTVKHPARFYGYMSENAISDQYLVHNYLLNFYGSLRNPGLSSMLYGFAGVLVFLIAFGSISLIYNSFSISVSDRTKQFGILKSVGATKKQIRGAVLYEALLLSAVSIPMGLIVGCLGIGVTLYCLRDAFSFLSTAARSGAVQMRLELSPAALVIAALVCLLTTLISAWIPALRALRISPIQAVRQNEDVKLRKRDVRTWSLTKKLFGFSGMMASKNFGRNRKRYRSTIISLFLSVTLFVSASSFCAYLTDAVGTVVTEGNLQYDIQYVDFKSENEQAREGLFSALMGVEGVEQGTYCLSTGEELRFPVEAYDSSFQNSTAYYGEDSEIFSQILFLRDEDFRTLCAENGLDPEAYFDQDAPVAAVLNDVIHSYFTEDGRRWERYSVLRSSALPVTGSYPVLPVVEDYTCAGYTEDGKTLIYYPEDYWNSVWSERPDGEGTPELVLDETKAIFLEPEWIEMTAAGFITRPSFNLADASDFTLVYPASMEKAVFSRADFDPGLHTYHQFAAPAHDAVSEKMKTLLMELGYPKGNLQDLASEGEDLRMLVTVVNVFSYGFIILISLIAVANVFNTISTNVSLRRREFAMLKSIGLGEKDFRKMMNYECLIYGFRGLMWGLPAAVLMTYVIYRVTGIAIDTGRFYLPWYSVVIAVGSVFAVVFATMLYATHRIRKDNPIDALKTETL